VLILLPQMHKEVPPPRIWRPLVIRHQAFVARVYVAADKQALSSKSCVQRPGMHDMGAISGYRSSRATSNLTTNSVSNASFGTAEQQQQEDDDAGSKPAVQKGSAPDAAGAAAVQANGIKAEQQEDAQQPMAVDGQQADTQQQDQHAQAAVEQQQQEQQQQEQQQDSDDAMLLPAPAQQAGVLIGSSLPGASGAELLAAGAAAPVVASTMEAT